MLIFIKVTHADYYERVHGRGKVCGMRVYAKQKMSFGLVSSFKSSHISFIPLNQA